MMSRRLTVTLLVLVLAVLATSTLPGRTWTDRRGRKVAAEFVDSKQGVVTIKRDSDGKVFQIPVDQLSDADQEFVNKLTRRTGSEGDALYEDKPVSHWIGQLKENRESQEKGVKALASIGAPAVPRLLQALKDPDGDVRAGAVLALANIGPSAKAAIPALIDLFAENDRIFLRVGAASAVKEIGGKEAIPQLIEALKNPSRDIRGIAAMALGYYKNDAEKAVPFLVDLLDDDDYWVSHHAASALRWIDKNPKAIRKLIEDLGSKNVKARRSAATELGHFEKDAKDAIPGLLEALKDGDKEVRENAGSSLKAIDREAAKQAGVE